MLTFSVSLYDLINTRYTLNFNDLTIKGYIMLVYTEDTLWNQEDMLILYRSDPEYIIHHIEYFEIKFTDHIELNTSHIDILKTCGLNPYIKRLYLKTVELQTLYFKKDTLCELDMSYGQHVEYLVLEYTSIQCIYINPLGG